MRDLVLRSINDHELPPEVVNIRKKPKSKNKGGQADGADEEQSDGGTDVHLHNIYEDMF